MDLVDFNGRFRPPAFLPLLDNKCQVWHKLSSAAQKRGFARGIKFEKQGKPYSPCLPLGGRCPEGAEGGTGLPKKSRQRVFREEEQRASGQSRERSERLAKFAPLRRSAGGPCSAHFILEAAEGNPPRGRNLVHEFLLLHKRNSVRGGDG